jgi:hypothetical protein
MPGGLGELAFALGRFGKEFRNWSGCSLKVWKAAASNTAG